MHRLIFIPATALLAVVVSAHAESPIRFNRDVRPILSDNCFRCHGPELKSRKAKLRLDVRESAVEREAIIPGKPDESELIRRILTTNPDDKMPPPDTHKVVTPAQVEVLRRWIDAGAEYEPHWSYGPVKRPEVPAVQKKNWAATPIDAFILTKLEENKIAPAPAANRATLLRRLALDLTGLPPTPAEVAAFEQDRSVGAYAKQVERLLASPHYGERMAVPWLDAVRFADTVGYHGDQNQNIFPYRDYVIAAFNRNEPFDKFTREQLAGDLLPQPTVEQKIATGFNRLNMITREGGAQPKEYLAKYAADRVRTVSTAWLGSTLACAQCHDHKYDPFTAKDFYTMAAFFDDVKQWGVYADYGYTKNPELKGFNNDYPFPPEIFVTNRFMMERSKQLTAARDNLLRTNLAKLPAAEFSAWKTEVAAFAKTFPDGWQIAPEPKLAMISKKPMTTLALAPDGSVLASGKGSDKDQCRVTFEPQPGWVAALRIELLPQATNGNSSFRSRSNNIAVRPVVEIVRAGGGTNKIKFHRSAATSTLPLYENGHETFDVHPRWRLSPEATTSRQYAVYLLDPPVQLAPGDALAVNLNVDNVACFRIATTPVANPDPLASGAKSYSANSKSDAAVAWVMSTTNAPTAFAELKRLNREILECRGGVVPTLVTVSTTNRLVTRVLNRGDWQDETGEIVAPAVPHFLPQPPARGTNLLTRLDLANWLVARDNPLTARAFVNRLWKQFFGIGLSNQPEELGTQGEWPSHPELLDWLAAEFMDSGWDVKHMVRLMVMSSAYQQDAKYRPELRDLDPNNRLVARQNARRLDAEFVRDNALAIAGMLQLDIGGPSVFPYQPDDYYANIEFPNRDYYASPAEQQYRRGLYMHWQRTFLHPMLANFDAPAREECTVDRPMSTTPQQALTLLNDPTFVEAARGFAEKILAAPKKDDAARVAFAVQTALLRPAKPEEQKSLLAFLATQRTHYTANPEDADKLLRVGNRPRAALPAAEHAAWTSLARVILNLHETITRY